MLPCVCHTSTALYHPHGGKGQGRSWGATKNTQTIYLHAPSRAVQDDTRDTKNLRAYIYTNVERNDLPRELKDTPAKRWIANNYE